MTALTSEVSEFITRARVGRLATADATGQPLVLPICYAFDARVRNIRENPKVSLVIDEYDDDWSRLRWVILQGLADVVTTGEDFAAAAELLLSKYPQYRAMGLSRERGTMIRITPQRVLRWQYAS